MAKTPKQTPEQLSEEQLKTVSGGTVANEFRSNTVADAFRPNTVPNPIRPTLNKCSEFEVDSPEYKNCLGMDMDG